MNTAGARLTRFEISGDEASSQTASRCKELLQVRNYMTAALKKECATSVRAIAIENVRNAVSTKYKEICFISEQSMGSANMEMARLEVKGFSVMKSRTPAWHTQSFCRLKLSAFPDLWEKARNFCELQSAFETFPRPMAS